MPPSGVLPIRKVYIDSRFKTASSSSDSNFKYELTETIQLPDKCACFIDDLIIPHSWYNIDNDNKYIYVKRYQPDIPLTEWNKLELEVQNHTLDSLKTALSNAFIAQYGAGQVAVSANSRTGIITITATGIDTIKLYTDVELRSANDWGGTGYDSNNLQSANEVLSNTSTQFATTINTNMIDLRRYHNIYISSPNIGSFSTLGPRGESNIIKKVPVSTDYGFMIFDNVVAPHDYMIVSKQLLKTLEFRLSDAYGRTIDLHGIPVSFSLIFMIIEDM